VNRGVSKKFPVFMLDSFELADNDLSRWLTEGLLNQLNHRTRLVIASRSIPGEHWSSWRELYGQINLEPFSFEVVKHYLSIRGLYDPDFVKTAFDITHGVPFALALISDLGLDKIDSKTLRLLRNQIAHGAVDRLIRIVSPLSVRIRQVLYAAAVLGEFNADTLSQVCGVDVKEEFELLREMSFVRSTPNGFEIHDVVRDYMLQALETDSPTELQKLEARSQYVHLSDSEKKVIEQIEANKSLSAASLSISLRILQSDTDKILRSLEQKELITQLSLTDDDEPLYSLSDNGVLIIQSIREMHP
jgi:DNA-binding MarR family transcriptional regulator